MRDKHSLNNILGLGFVVLLGGLTLANLFHKDEKFSEMENRMLEQRPEFRITELADGRFMTDFEKYQTDQFVFRNQWIQIQTAVDQLLGKNKSGDVYLGEDQLFEEPAVIQTGTRQNLKAMGKFCERHPEVKSYLLLAPNAASVQREGLPEYAPVADQEKQLEKIRRYLEERKAPVTEIPVYETLREHRDEYLYYRSDHHWTTRGAWYAYEKMAEVMELPAAEQTEKIIEKQLYPVTDSFQGTLSARSGYAVTDDRIEIWWPEREEELVVTYVQEQKKSASLYAAEKLETKDKYGMFLNGNHPLTEIRTMASTGRRLLLVKDSYANCLVPFLTGEFEKIVLVDPRYYYDSLEKLMEQYDFTDLVFLYNLNTFLEDDVLHELLEA